VTSGEKMRNVSDKYVTNEWGKPVLNKYYRPEKLSVTQDSDGNVTDVTDNVTHNVKRYCATCGNGLIGGRPDRKFCSVNCRKAYSRGKRMQGKKRMKCPHCGKYLEL
jgi:endogenous inhibitor of DNA gyrase (YacG/DUF329 family)